MPPLVTRGHHGEKSSAGRTRTHENSALATPKTEFDAQIGSQIREGSSVDPDLTLIATAWPMLAQHVKATVLMIVETAIATIGPNRAEGVRLSGTTTDLGSS